MIDSTREAEEIKPNDTPGSYEGGEGANETEQDTNLDSLVAQLEELPEEAGFEEIRPLLEQVAALAVEFAPVDVLVLRKRLVVAIGSRLSSPAAYVNAALRGAVNAAKAKVREAQAADKADKAAAKNADRMAEEAVKAAERQRAAGDRARDQRPQYEVVDGSKHEAVRFAIEQLALDDRVYRRGSQLATITLVKESEKMSKRVRRAVGAAVISQIGQGHLYSWLQQIIAFGRYDSTFEGEEVWVPWEAPSVFIGSVLTLAAGCPDVRPLVGIATTPILHDDGSIYNEPGYDPESGLVYVPRGAPLFLNDVPTKDNAADALEQLEEVVRDFPFASDIDRTGWLSALLTLIARPLCPTVPLHVFDANSAGSGKGLLVNVIAAIVLGHDATVSPFTTSDEEVRKKILSLLLAGDTCALIDNVPTGGAIGWPSFDALLTADHFGDRVLGKSMYADLVNNLTWFATGNNVVIQGDTVRRTLRIRLESPLEHPADRPPSDFDHADLLGWVRAERPRLLSAALTVLSAYLRAGRPGAEGRTLGSFDDWSDVVRGTLVWLGRPDPVDLLASRNVDADPLTEPHAVLLTELLRLAVSKGKPQALSAAEILGLAMREKESGKKLNQSLHDALVELAGPVAGRELKTQQVGYVLRALRGRVRQVQVLGDDKPKLMKLDHTTTEKRRAAVRWCVQPVIGN